MWKAKTGKENTWGKNKEVKIWKHKGNEDWKTKERRKAPKKNKKTPKK